MFGYLLSALVGAALVFFLDPAAGGYRRSVARDRLAGLMRRGSRQMERSARRVGSDISGMRERVAAGDGGEDLDDAALAQKVMSELFRDRRIPKGAVSVNAVGGVIQLRGEIDDAATIERIVEQARRIEGVADVENLLHLPGEPAPRS